MRLKLQLIDSFKDFLLEAILTVSLFGDFFFQQIWMKDDEGQVAL